MGLGGGFAFWAAQGQSRVEGRIFLPVLFSPWRSQELLCHGSVARGRVPELISLQPPQAATATAVSTPPR